MADYRGTPGNLGVFVLERSTADAVHFVTLTYWTDLEAIRAFAGRTRRAGQVLPRRPRLPARVRARGGPLRGGGRRRGRAVGILTQRRGAARGGPVSGGGGRT
ncbi:hypothetical protein [Oceanithermus desulfurans]|uniref:hypothetical protein n=1 Tax=Oceanithermus desulfurans TaxID=227924 RepID=UPI003530EA10